MDKRYQGKWTSSMLADYLLDTEEGSKSSPVTGLEWPRGFQEVKVSRLHDNGTGLVVRLSALRTGRLYPQEIILVLISVRG